jgi:hypothetical protein
MKHFCRQAPRLLFLTTAVLISSLNAQTDSVTGPSLSPQIKAIILGCENNIKDKKWKDYRISFGVVDLLAQNLFDSGTFILVEEKTEIRDKLKSFNEILWNKGQKKVLADAQTLVDSAAIVIGRLVYCGAPRTNVSIGPVHASRNDIVIKTEVDLVLPGGKTFTGKGMGKSTRTALSAMFEYRGDKPLFEQSNLGLALKDAVAMAVTDMVNLYAKEQQQ